ncbi:MAG: MFS transporter [Chloroflexi bacterium]|nr:MFS transporter [Chloroflexota bacterium]
MRLMWLANLSAQAAAWGLIVSRGWLVFDMTGSSMDVGIVTFAAMVPLVFVPPIAGVLADRVDRRTLLGSTYALNMAQNLVLGLLAGTGTIEEWHVVTLSFINGIARAAQQSTSQALAANLVPPERLLNALSLTGATQHGARLVGPALVTPLLAVFGAPAAFFLCTSLYGVGWWLIGRIESLAVGGGRRDESLLVSFVAGLRYAWAEPLIKMMILLVMFHCGLTMAFESLLPNFALQRVGAGSTGFSTLMIGVGIGGLVGSISIGGVTEPRTRGRLYLALGLLSGLGQAGLSFATGMPLAFLAVVIMGASQAAFMTMSQSTIQALGLNEYRGRLASLNTFSLGGIMSLMNLANGFLGTSLPASVILLSNGLLFAAIMAVSFASAVARMAYREGLPVATRPRVAIEPGLP